MNSNELRSKLKAWLKKHDKNEIYVAAKLNIHPITVKRFLEGRNVQRIISDGFESLVRESEQPPKVA